jgi:hypothetical protein
MRLAHQAGAWRRLRAMSMFGAALAAPALSGCMVGPDYKGPPVTAPCAMQAHTFHRGAVAPVNAGPPLAAWWVALDDSELNDIEDLALQASPSVAEHCAPDSGLHGSSGKKFFLYETMIRLFGNTRN